MTHVLTLVSHHPSFIATKDHIQEIKNAFSQAGDHAWLKEGIAVDIPMNFEKTPGQLELAEVQTTAIQLLGFNFNVYCQPTENRRKKLLIADMDSTIIQQECIDEIGNVLGLKEKIAQITERAMNGEIEFENALIERVGLLKGITRDELQQVLDHAIKLTPGARTLVQTMNGNGAFTALISGGFTFFTSHIAQMVGFQHNQANELLFENDLLTGEVSRPILGKAAKKEALIALRDKHSISAKQTLAVGDGANDLAMIEEASLGVAFHAKPAVAAAANAAVNKGDLTHLLYFQGYTEEEFIS